MKERPTIRDVAARAGVSVATVSYVINGKGGVGPETRERVLAAASALGFRPDAAARQLATRRTALVGVVVGDACGHRGLTLTFFGRVLDAVSRSLPEHGYEALLLRSGEAPPARPTAPELGNRFDGAILVGVGRDDGVLSELRQAALPCVGIDFETDELPCGYVGSDNARGTHLLVRHLHSRGHRRIATISGAIETVAGAQRLAAFLHEAGALGLGPPDEYVRFADFSSEAGYREARALMSLQSPPSAIVAASDLMALAAMQAVRDVGVEPGRDVAVVGFDDLESAGLAHPRLTTVRQHRDALGAEAARAIAEMIADRDAPPPRKLVPVELVVRDSSGGRLAA